MWAWYRNSATILHRFSILQIGYDAAGYIVDINRLSYIASTCCRSLTRSHSPFLRGCCDHRDAISCDHRDAISRRPEKRQVALVFNISRAKFKKGGLVNIYTVAFLIGRVLVGGFFLVTGSDHFVRLKAVASYARAKGVPAPALAAVISGILLLFGGESLLLGFHQGFGILMLLIFLLPSSFLIHNFWAIRDAKDRMNELAQFQKNIAIVGLLLMAALIQGPWPVSFADLSRPGIAAADSHIHEIARLPAPPLRH